MSAGPARAPREPWQERTARTANDSGDRTILEAPVRALLSAALTTALLVPLAPTAAAFDAAPPTSVVDDGATDDPKVVAHRGGAAYGPENTMLAVENGQRLGVDSIEVDVMFSADDELVIIHDDTLERTTDCHGHVIDHTVEQLQECDAAYWWSPGQAPTVPHEELDHPLRGTGITVPTLREMLRWASTLRDVPELAIEVKSIPGESNFDPVGRAMAEEVVALVDEFDLADDVIVFSFWPTVIDHVKVLDPALRTLLLTTSEAGILATEGLLYATARGHDAVGPNHDAPDMHEQFVATAALLGREVYTYTVDTVGEQQRAIDLGVDGVISDWPACTLELLDRPVRGPVLPPEARAQGTRLAACP
jgi:glycerophosphoryl diester phosphodiesterase